MKIERDGIWKRGGLEADFRLLYAHPTAKDIYRVVTAAGESYAPGSELEWCGELPVDNQGKSGNGQD